MKILLGIFIGLLLFMQTQPTYAVDIRFSGFGDVSVGVRSADAADPIEETLFDQFGTGSFPPSAHEGFTITGVDFVTIVDLTEDFTFLAEVNFQAARQESSEFEVDVERVFINYDLDPRFNLQAGLYFTPIGYHNRFLYSRAWLMNSIQIPDLFEEELNLVPTHSIGVNANGTFHFDNGHALRYVVGLHNGRGPAPDHAIYARDPDSGNEITWLAEWVVPMFNESRIGFSGWWDKIDSYYVPDFGDVVDANDPAAQRLKMDETGFDFYITIRAQKFDILFEYVTSVK